MRICLVYDCLFPYTVGGAERWYRNLGERLAADGHEVTYLTLRQWARGERGEVPGVRVVAVGPRMSLYAQGGRRRILPPLVFGLGVLWHLLWRGSRYDVVHTASFPYFSLLAGAALRPLRRFQLVVDWHEVWSRSYWIEYLGPFAGRIGDAVQALCLRVPQRAFCFSHLHGRRLREQRVNGELSVLEGEYAGSLEAREPAPAEPVVVFAGRHIPEKRVPALVPALALARERIPELRGEVYGDGPERAQVLRLRSKHGLDGALEVPGFVPAKQVEDSLSRALCMVLPSRRVGYGLVVVEAAALGTPS
ncbi:MAG: glycosyltransferase family 4 protein, partial [Thermoleophilaceae bacterium]